MTDTVPVTQADRETAANYERFMLNDENSYTRGIVNGRHDSHPLVQAFARHRLATEQSRASAPAVGREAIEAAARAMCDRVNGIGDYDENIKQRRTGWMAQAEAGLNAAILALHPPVMGEVEAENARLREALKPFAKAGSIAGERNPYGDFYAYRPAAGDEYAITGDHLRAAHAALATLSTEQEK